MATITSLERSLQNCSLNHQQSSSSSSSSVGIGSSSTAGNQHDDLSYSADNTLELNSQISLPYHWEQCLDLKTGEIYYLNRSTGMKAKEDPRTTAESSGDIYSEGDSSYDSEGSSSESSPSSSREPINHRRNDKKGHVLVVAGCKRCLMYFMLPKQVEDCPKCSGQLLHFDRSDNSFP
ncbi:unnamed protein product [Ilex paraguariensis]|uniref:WW domain-containing protein n=1 Tax=Ilex paraguariensis TaxID=185542 RepID=A0ABC8SRF3_9AQUA